jgi:hypothetical protein
VLSRCLYNADVSSRRLKKENKWQHSDFAFVSLLFMYGRPIAGAEFRTVSNVYMLATRDPKFSRSPIRLDVSTGEHTTGRKQR